jgi:ATP-dependent helicase/nuclease subunit A
MTDQAPFRPPDWQAREAALDPRRSLIVQAPAGSGKTELLTQRILTLLGSAERPEAVLAITFTRKAAHEMRQRLLDTLVAAQHDTPLGDPHQQVSRRLALQVLEQDRRHAWQLLQNPSRLQVLTIDSLCASLVRRMPWLSRFGATPEIRDDATPLYRQAADQLVERIRSGGSGVDQVATLLRHLDNRSDLLRDLLADMLGKRDQWLRHLLGQDVAASRQILEAGLRSFIGAQLQVVAALLPAGFAAELAASLVYAAEQLARAEQLQLAALGARQQLPPAEVEQLAEWQSIVELLLTRTGEARKRANKNQGFPADQGEQGKAMKQRFEALLEQLAAQPELCGQLARLRELPRPNYSEAEWRLIEALVTLLPLAVVELELVFRQRGQADFIAIAAAARAALGDDEAPEDLLLQIDSSLQHILVDEFQDTSYGQYVLLQLLTAGWMDGDGRTLFVVGDPMQSIYRFREAEVGLFLRARRAGLGFVRLDPLQLTANFRSSAALVDWFNQVFAELFPQLEDEARGAVCFAAATPVKPAGQGPALACQALAGRDDAAEAALVLEAIGAARSSDPQQKIGILVRSRSHATAIVAALDQANIRYQARDIVALKQRSIIQDLLALTQALLQRGNRVAWLAVLRAPWCGLSLQELLTLVGEDRKTPVIELLRHPEPQAELFAAPDPQRHQRLVQVTRLLDAALERRGRVSLRALVESTWLALAGPACCAAAELADARQYFALLEQLDSGGDIARLGDLESTLDGLFAAPDPLADESLQLMTIHKSKGLEFDQVILPGLGRTVRGSDKPLLRWLEHPDYELLLAPIPAADGSGEGATYAAIGNLLKEKEALELIRLLYVAVTRARQRLLLIGHLQPTAAGDYAPLSGSLLAAGWSALSEQFVPDPEIVEELTSAEPTARLVRQLPPDYRLPDWPPNPDFFLAQTTTASRFGAAAEELLNRAENSAARLIGEAVHAWFERHAGADLVAAGASAAAFLRRQLLQRGLPAGQLAAATERALQAVTTALQGERGRWLLQAYPDQAVELALTGLLAGQLVQAKIDRTFVSDDNVRWVIDYKTAQPAQGEALAAFYQAQTSRYAPQLTVYRQLLQGLEPERQVKMALYFPAFDGWCELE